MVRPVSWAYSAIAANDRAPVRTAHDQLRVQRSGVSVDWVDRGLPMYNPAAASTKAPERSGTRRASRAAGPLQWRCPPVQAGPSGAFRRGPCSAPNSEFRAFLTARGSGWNLRSTP